MTVGHILNQKGTAVVTARPDDTVHEVGKLLLGVFYLPPVEVPGPPVKVHKNA